MKKSGHPLENAEVCALSALDTVLALRSGRLTTQRYIETLLERAQQVSHLNAFITLNESGAQDVARRFDRARKAGEELPPLAGLAIVVKDNINTCDMPTTAGTPALRGKRPRTTAPSLQRLLGAGAIVLGKTNMHELAFGITSTNHSSFAGPVRNPYDPSRIPGGSSGGTAAAIAARVTACGLGTDTGGSVRLPAALCGIAGLRPSVGDNRAQRRYHDDRAVVPISHTRDTIGPMGRTVEDLTMLDAVIAGAPAAAALPLASMRIGLPGAFWQDLDDEVAAVATVALEPLRSAGATLVEINLDEVMELNAKISFQLALHEPNIAIPAYLAASGLDGITLGDIAGQVASPDVKGIFGAVMGGLFRDEYEEVLSERRPALQRAYARCFEQHRLDALLFPTSILPAALIDLAAGSGNVMH